MNVQIEIGKNLMTAILPFGIALIVFVIALAFKWVH